MLGFEVFLFGLKLACYFHVISTIFYCRYEGGGRVERKKEREIKGEKRERDCVCMCMSMTTH